MATRSSVRSNEPCRTEVLIFFSAEDERLKRVVSDDSFDVATSSDTPDRDDSPSPPPVPTTIKRKRKSTQSKPLRDESEDIGPSSPPPPSLAPQLSSQASRSQLVDCGSLPTIQDVKETDSGIFQFLDNDSVIAIAKAAVKAQGVQPDNPTGDLAEPLKLPIFARKSSYLRTATAQWLLDRLETIEGRKPTASTTIATPVAAASASAESSIPNSEHSATG